MNRILSLGLIATLSCGGGGDSEPTGPYLRFDLPADPTAPIPIAGLPFPNDALLGADGKILVTAQTISLDVGADPEVVDNFVRALAGLSGFGVLSGALFPVAQTDAGERVDPATLAGRVQLVDLATGLEVPITPTVRYDGAIHAQPALGHVLRGGGTYAYLLLAGIATTQGRALVADPDLVRLLGSETPSGPAARIAARYASLRAHLATAAIDPATVIGATVFTTANQVSTMEAVRQILDEQAPAAAIVDRIYHSGAELDGLLGTPLVEFPGADNEGGIAHGNLEAVVLGHFAAVDFTSPLARTLGTWSLDAAGVPAVKGMEDVPFLLALPAGRVDWQDVPIMIMQHGFGSSRAVVMAVANTMAGQGFAVIGIDIPAHGDRFHAARDSRNNFTDEAVPDGLADADGANTQLDFLDVIGDRPNGVIPLDPQVMTASIRQAVADVMSEVRLIDEGDFSALAVEFPGLSFRSDRLVYSGQSLGGLIGTVVTTLDPRVGAAVLGVPGGGIARDMIAGSPWLWQGFGIIFVGALGAPDLIPGTDQGPQTHLGFMLMQTYIDAADPIAFASHTILDPLAGGAPKQVLVIAAHSDEVVTNQSTQALAAVLGLEWLATGASPAQPEWVVLPTVQGPTVQGNLSVGGAPVTAVLVELTPATHGLQTHQEGISDYEPGFPPFVRRAATLDITNPIVEVQTMTAGFARSYVETGLATVTDPF